MCEQNPRNWQAAGVLVTVKHLNIAFAIQLEVQARVPVRDEAAPCDHGCDAGTDHRAFVRYARARALMHEPRSPQTFT